jgi:hypothetical protein
LRPKRRRMSKVVPEVPRPSSDVIAFRFAEEDLLPCLTYIYGRLCAAA